MTRLAASIALLAAAGCAGQALAPTRPGPRVEERGLAEVVERALPAVVLLINTRGDGSTSYGAGLVVGDGLVLTSEHVVQGRRSLGGMLYRRDRLSYTPMDGGLARYLFENQGEIVKAEVVREDATADLAVVRLEADTSALPRLPLSARRVRPGDRVYALGHPQETVWSFTSGVVGALHHGALQHDAVVSHGSSGGPLLDERGEVVGINTARVVSEARGLAFARPIAMAGGLLQLSGLPPLDLSTPERAAMSCWRAQELASASLAECFDWDHRFELFLSAVDEVKGRAPGRERLEERYRRPGSKERWIADGKRTLSRCLTRAKRPEGGAEPPAWGEATPDPEGGGSLVELRRRAMADLKAREERLARERREVNGIKADVSDPKVLQALLRMGLRVEETRTVTSDRAWVRLGGRNLDGTSYRLSECWARVGDRWLQRSPPSPGDLAMLPDGWPPPIEDYEVAREKMVTGLLGSDPPPG